MVGVGVAVGVGVVVGVVCVVGVGVLVAVVVDVVAVGVGEQVGVQTRLSTWVWVHEAATAVDVLAVNGSKEEVVGCGVLVLRGEVGLGADEGGVACVQSFCVGVGFFVVS